MDATNIPLQLIECIESMKNDVKGKIGARDHLRAMSAGSRRGIEREMTAREPASEQPVTMLMMVRPPKS